jgi:predicted RNA-binding Zn ribbon-like protein
MTSSRGSQDGFVTIGEPLAVDLVNTSDPMEGTRAQPLERLPDVSDVRRWVALQAGRLPPDSGLPAPQAMWRLRRSVRLVFAGVVHGRPVPTGAVPQINDTAAAAWYTPRLHLEAGREPWREDLRMRWGGGRAAPGAVTLAALARSAIELLTGADRPLLRACGYRRCGGFFVGRDARRRWCCAACGARARVARAEGRLVRGRVLR